MPLLTNPWHLLMMENFVDYWITKKKPDIVLHSNDGHHFKIHKELFGRTPFMRNILAASRSIGCRCMTIRISVPCSKEHLEHLVQFLYLGEVRLDEYCEETVATIFENLEKVFGFPNDIRSNCEEGEDSDDESDDESVDASTFAVNRDEPSDDERDFGTYEEQKLRMEERIKELDRLKEMTQNSDREVHITDVLPESENVRILYNFRWDDETEIPSEKSKKKGSKSKKKTENSMGKVKDVRFAAKKAKIQKSPGKFTCDQCGYSANHRGNFEKHVNTVHLKLKPFKCDECGESYGQKENLKIHIEAVHEGLKPHICIHCQKLFPTKINMDRHVSSVHDKIRHKCDFCEETLSSKSHLSRHMKKVHEK